MLVLGHIRRILALVVELEFELRRGERQSSGLHASLSENTSDPKKTTEGLCHHRLILLVIDHLLCLVVVA